MKKNNKIQMFNNGQVRTHWDEDREAWYFSVVDVIAVLTDSPDAKRYWSVLKTRIINEQTQPTTICSTLKMLAQDGKMRLTDVADTEQVLRIVQSVPSKKAEPFKLWLAQVGRERIDEIENPELGFDRLMETYLRKGYSKEWINQRLKSIEVRKDLTDEWQERGVQKQQYAILTNEITKAWSGLEVKEYKNLKNLKKENLRDHMTNLELVLNMLAEATTTEISKEKKPDTFSENKTIARQGGTIAGNTRKEIEEKTGKNIVSPSNAKTLSDPNSKKNSLNSRATGR